jgi:hypothetical protein
VRTIPGRPVEPSWLYVPADPVLRDHAAMVETELRRAMRPDEPELDALEFDRPDRRETEPSETPAFIPLSADVAPQMTLFGPPAPAPAALAFGTAPPAPAAVPGGPETRPTAEAAFERRARLRDERHRLVSEVRRRDGSSHREVNAWLNRKLGITSVDAASLEDLERSVELLVAKLSARR